MSGIISQNVARTSGLVKAAAAGGGVWTLIKTLTASGDSDLSFVNGSDDVTLDSTYPIYVFKFINIHPETDGADFSFQGNAAGGSGYNETITSTFFSASQSEGGVGGQVSYTTSMDLAQSTSFIPLNNDVGADNDQQTSGYLYIFNPSSTTFVKHFMSRSGRVDAGDYVVDCFSAGYFNTTSAIDEIQFKFDSGDIDAGTVKLYGIGDS